MATPSNEHVVIPGSRRPDGTVRKPIRVRAGYVPPEEQKMYETVKARLAREAAAAPKPGSIEANPATPPPGSSSSSSSSADATPPSAAAAKKKPKKKKAAKKPAAGPPVGGFEIVFEG